uniref:Uncharacterized protein n=1 Tax=Ciona savignyi TaxID=51511 RepID=H2ZD42_CIOSA
MILLATMSSGLPLDERSYYTETKFLTIYNIFVIAVETLMLIACVWGFLLFRKTSHQQKEEGEDLDAALLLVCLGGPILFGTFSLLAIIAGEDNKIQGWLLALGYPISDSLQCVGQVIFVLYGLKREPMTEPESKET